MHVNTISMLVRSAAVAAAMIVSFAGARGAEAQTPPSPQSSQSPKSPPVTFAGDVAPILYEHCAVCHHPNGSAPFSLLTYADARQRATLIASLTKSRTMPPWKAEPGYGEFVGQKPLEAAEIATLQQWLADGAPEGDTHALRPPVFTDDWQLGKPDVIVTLPAPYAVAAGGPDFSRVFVFPLPVGTRKYVRGLEFRPGNTRIVHHANIRTDRTRASRELDEADPVAGYEGLILHSATYPDGHFLGWTPGQLAPLLPKGLAWSLEPGTDLVVEVHMVPGGKAERIQPSIGLYFTDDPPERTPAALRLGRQTIDIPAGEKNWVSTDSFVLPVDVEVHAVQPHAHYRATQVSGTATLPDGTTKPLIYIKDWDFRWQHVYRYAQPFMLPRGTTLSMRYTYDNSADNPRNPQLPPRRVHWGQWSTDEMGDLWIQVLPKNDQDLHVLNQAFEPKAIDEDLIGFEVMLRDDPSKVALHDTAASLYLRQGRADDAVRHFEASAKINPASAAAHYNLGTALTAANRLDESVAEYREALRLRPGYALAHNNLGSLFLRMGKPDEALGQFKEAVTADPSNAEAHYNVGSMERFLGNWPEAIAQYREAQRLQPSWATPAAGLAWLLTTVPVDSLRNSAEALVLAESAAEMTQRRDPGTLDVLAAAYAAAGQFDKAVATAQAALDLEPAKADAAIIAQRQALYRQGKAYRLAPR